MFVYLIVDRCIYHTIPHHTPSPSADKSTQSHTSSQSNTSSQSDKSSQTNTPSHLTPAIVQYQIREQYQMRDSDDPTKHWTTTDHRTRQQVVCADPRHIPTSTESNTPSNTHSCIPYHRTRQQVYVLTHLDPTPHDTSHNLHLKY